MWSIFVLRYRFYYWETAKYDNNSNNNDGGNDNNDDVNDIMIYNNDNGINNTYFR